MSLTVDMSGEGEGVEMDSHDSKGRRSLRRWWQDFAARAGVAPRLLFRSRMRSLAVIVGAFLCLLLVVDVLQSLR